MGVTLCLVLISPRLVLRLTTALFHPRINSRLTLVYLRSSFSFFLSLITRYKTFVYRGKKIVEYGAMIDFIQIYLEEKSKNLTRPSRKNKDKNTIKVERHFGSKMTISCRVPVGNQQGLPHHAMQHVLRILYVGRDFTIDSRSICFELDLN